MINKQYIGRQSISFANGPYIHAYASVVGKKEGEGPLAKYFTEISANEAIFDEDGTLVDLIATKYDFEGKADFIVKVREELGVKPDEITFVGNGSNDIWAYKSGARTICINPKDADEDKTEKWTKVLPIVKDLSEILEYID